MCVYVSQVRHTVWCVYKEAALDTHHLWKELAIFIMYTHAHAHSSPTCTRTQQQVAGQVLTQFKEHPESWTRVDTILELANNQKTKVRLCSDVKGREEGQGMPNVAIGITSLYHGLAGMVYMQFVRCSLCAPQSVGGSVV